MKKKQTVYLAPVIEPQEVTVERGIADSSPTPEGHGINSFSSVDDYEGTGDGSWN